MLRNLALLLGVCCIGASFGERLVGAPVEVKQKNPPPGFEQAFQKVKIGKQLIEIKRITQQVVAGVKYDVDFTVGPRSCFGVQKYSSSAECTQAMESCHLSYVVQAWKKDNLTLAGDENAEICKSSKVRHAVDPDLHQAPYNSTKDDELRVLFDSFISDYGRTYRPDSNDGEYWMRFTVFKKNLMIAEQLQRTEMGTAKYGITKFMDVTNTEFKTHMAPGFTKPVSMPREVDVIPAVGAPESWDWRDHGAVTEVKNQGTCGSCWAFSTTGNIEGQWFLKKGKLVSLSEQELVDCDTEDQGCNGGLPSNAYLSIEKLGGLETEGDYPYEARGERCSFKPKEIAVYINDSVSLPTDEEKLAAWLYKNGPISIGINAFAMQFYMGGISHPWKIFCNPKSLDHGVLIVGYGVEDEKPFWIIKNSWGPNWGEQGYYRIYRGDDSCGVNQMATSSIVN